MKASIHRLRSPLFFLSACLGAACLLSGCASAQSEVVDFLAAGREVPVSTSAREVRAQPVMQIVEAEFYGPSSEPGAVKRSADENSEFQMGASYLDFQDSSSNIAYSRIANPSPFPILSLLDMFSSKWEDPDDEDEADELEEDEVGLSWTDDDMPMQGRSQPKLRYRRRF